MKFEFIWESKRWYTKWKVYQSKTFYDYNWHCGTYLSCERILVNTDNGGYCTLEKRFWKLIHEEIIKWTEVINTQTNEMKYALWIRTIGSEYYIIVKHNQESLAWRYSDCEIVTKEVTETLINNDNIMNTLDKLIADEEFSAEVMANIANKYKKIKSQIKSLEEDIKTKQELLDLNLDLAHRLNQWVETKNIELVNEVLTTMWE